MSHTETTEAVERLVEEFRARFHSLLGKPVCCPMKNSDCGCDGHTYTDEAVALIEDALTTIRKETLEEAEKIAEMESEKGYLAHRYKAVGREGRFVPLDKFITALKDTKI